jgi:cephalosporin hydroxylase
VDAIAQFQHEVAEQIRAQGCDADLHALTRAWLREITPYKYHYHFTWLGRPIIQLPQDVLAVQELIWRVQPDLIVETGVAHGGSLMLSASILALLGGDRRVLGIDVEVRPHNRQRIESHPLSSYIDLIEGSSIDDEVFRRVQSMAAGRQRVLVLLDSCHTHDHVLRELELYSTLVRAGSYLVVFDTLIELMPDRFFSDRPWGQGNNPLTAVRQFIQTNDRFEVDRELTNKLLITAAPDGYLRCVKDT